MTVKEKITMNELMKKIQFETKTKGITIAEKLNITSAAVTQLTNGPKSHWIVKIDAFFEACGQPIEFLDSEMRIFNVPETIITTYKLKLLLKKYYVSLPNGDVYPIVD